MPRDAPSPETSRGRCCPASPCRDAREYPRRVARACVCAASSFLLPSRPKNLCDSSSQLLPLARFNRQLPLALCRQSVELCPAIIFRGSFRDRYPSPLDQPVQRWIKRSLLNLEYIVRPELDCFGDGLTVHGAELQSAENQKIQSALQQLDPFVLFTGRHARGS